MSVTVGRQRTMAVPVAEHGHQQLPYDLYDRRMNREYAACPARSCGTAWRMIGEGAFKDEDEVGSRISMGGRGTAQTKPIAIPQGKPYKAYDTDGEVRMQNRYQAAGVWPDAHQMRGHRATDCVAGIEDLEFEDVFDGGQCADDVSHTKQDSWDTTREFCRIVQSLSSPATNFELRLLNFLQSALRNVSEESRRREKFLMQLQSSLSQQGLVARITDSSPRVSTPNSAFSGRHSFIIVENPLEKRSVYIVEVALKSHFIIARPSKRYEVILESLPDVFVGRKENLQKLVQFLCERAAESFR